MEKIKKYFNIFALCALIVFNAVVFSQPVQVIAQTNAAGQNCAANDPLCIPKSPFNGGLATKSTLGDLITNILQILLALAGVIAVVLIIVGGYQYMTSGGNEEQAEKGRRALTNAIIGLGAIILAYAIVQIVSNFLTGRSGFTF